MSSLELQEEEREVLRAIYEGDERFKEVSPVVFQYRIGEQSDVKTCLVEISWNDRYPDELPVISLDAFYNKLISGECKANIVSKLTEQAHQLLGAAMTYTLFEYAKDNLDELMTDQPQNQAELSGSLIDPGPSADAGKAKDKKEQLTKAQKRKLINRHDDKGELPRGWNWVDVVKHLCQTGHRTTENNS